MDELLLERDTLDSFASVASFASLASRASFPSFEVIKFFNPKRNTSTELERSRMEPRLLVTAGDTGLEDMSTGQQALRHL